MSGRAHVIRDPHVEIAVAIACYAVAIWLVWDAYERRGKPRSFLAGIFLP